MTQFIKCSSVISIESFISDITRYMTGKKRGSLVEGLNPKESL